MKKILACLIIGGSLLFMAGCAFSTKKTGTLASSPPEIGRIELTDKLKKIPSSPPTVSHGPDTVYFAKEGAAVSLGMEKEDIKSVLVQNGIEYSEKGAGSYDEMTNASCWLAAEDNNGTEYLLGFQKNTLESIIWNTYYDINKRVFHIPILSEFFKYSSCPFPSYTAGLHSDMFVFDLGGSYYTQLHVRPENGHNYICNRYSLKDNSKKFLDSDPASDGVYFIGDICMDCTRDGIGYERAEKTARGNLGAFSADGLEQSYTCEGIALYEKCLYYCLRWSQLVPDDNGGAHSSYNGRVLVTLDGSRVIIPAEQ